MQPVHRPSFKIVLKEAPKVIFEIVSVKSTSSVTMSKKGITHEFSILEHPPSCPVIDHPQQKPVLIPGALYIEPDHSIGL